MSDEWKHMGFYEYTALIEQRGLAKGVAEGEARGEARERAQSILRERQSIISLAVGLLPPENIEQLRSIQDLDELRAAIQAALRERVR